MRPIPVERNSTVPMANVYSLLRLLLHPGRSGRGGGDVGSASRLAILRPEGEGIGERNNKGDK